MNQKFRNHKQSLLIVLLLCFFFSSEALAGDNTNPGWLTSHATINSIGLEWEIDGDDNHDAQCQIQYRISGTDQWHDFIPLYRVDYNGANTLAGSILFLEPGAVYEINLVLSDPDGGSESRTETITTRGIPLLPVGGRLFHVTPGTGGGDGSSGDPFQGITAAQNVAGPGDIFLLHGGNYGGEIEFNVSGAPGSYIVWKGAGDGAAVIDGIRVNADYIWLENLKVENRDQALLTYSSPEGVVIKGNEFINCHYSIRLNHGGNNWHIVDNTITGDQIPGECIDSACFSGEGIELDHTSGHVVAYNTISQVADGISYPHKNCDIFGNDIFDTSDDGIEIDYGYANIRVWQNRISNPKNNGISFQPVNGAPWYVLRNQVAAPNENAIKFRGADRALIAHNTFVGWSGVEASGACYLSRVQSNNNLWISVQPRYAWECGYDDGFEPFWGYNLDYDGFDWSGYFYFAKWKGTRYETIADFTIATGLEEHGVMVDKASCFETFETAQPPLSMPSQYMTLIIDCNAVDAGIPLAGINDDYSGIAPDLGAYETNTPLPHYGVRKIDYDNDGDIDGFDLAALAALQSGLRELLTVFTIRFGRNDCP